MEVKNALSHLSHKMKNTNQILSCVLQGHSPKMGQMITIPTMFLMLMALVPTFECYSMGAPDAACNAMTPGHSLEPQKVNQQNDWISGSFRAQ